VLSIVWLLGVGSLLAVIFAIIALRQIGRSGGRMAGQGLATAGLVIGIVGFVGTAGLAAIGATHHPTSPSLDQTLPTVTVPLSTTPTVAKTAPVPTVPTVTVPVVRNPFAPHVLALGTTGVLAVNDPSGMRSLVVYSVTSPTTTGAPVGEEMIYADVGVCAGPNGSPEGASNFGLTLKSGATIGRAYTAHPTLTTLPIAVELGPNACEHGYVTFDFGTGGVPASVSYIGTDTMYAWRIS